MRTPRRRSRPALGGLGLPPGDPDPGTVAWVGLSSSLPVLLIGLGPGVVAAVRAPDLGPPAVALAVTILALAVGLGFGVVVVGRAHARRWEGVRGGPPPHPLVIGLTRDDLVLWTVERAPVPRWHPVLVLGRDEVRLRRTRLGGLVVRPAVGPEIVLGGDIHARRAFRRIAGLLSHSA